MVTIKDIAKKAGVSVSTVSRVINHRPDVSESAKQKVLTVAKELHYIPNESARDLAGLKTDAIGLILRGIDNPFFSEIFGMMEQMIHQSKYSLVIHQISSTANEIQAGAELARAKRLCGLIFMGGSFSCRKEDIDLLDVPFVFCTYTNTFGNLKKSEYSSVSIDDEQAAYYAVSHLIQLGHRKIAILLADTADQSISELRYRGYCRALQENGIAIKSDLIRTVRNFSLQEAYKTTQKLLSEQVEFESIFAISDILAIAAMKALADHQLKVPEDISVIGIDGLNISEFCVPTLSTMCQPKEKIAAKTIEVLLKMIDEQMGNQQILLNTTLREGQSIQKMII